MKMWITSKTMCLRINLSQFIQEMVHPLLLLVKPWMPLFWYWKIQQKHLWNDLRRSLVFFR